MSELYYAEMEAARNEAEDAYFQGRPKLETPQAHMGFRAGFERAFQKLWNERPTGIQSYMQPTGVCQHDQTRPNPTLVPLGTADITGAGWVWHCSGCHHKFALPLLTASTQAAGAAPETNASLCKHGVDFKKERCMQCYPYMGGDADPIGDEVQDLMDRDRE